MPRQFKADTHEQMNLILTKADMQLFKEQAEKLGQDRTGYIRLILKLDAATGLIEMLKDNTGNK